MKNRILPLILILFIIISPSTSLVTNVHAEQTTNSSCNLKILIQVAYNTTSDDPEQLYLFRGDLEAKLISEVNGEYVGIIPTLREKLEEKGCSVHIDWQFDIGRPRHWWKPEYGGNLPETNLISNYNIIIFLGHGEKAAINLTIYERVPNKSGKFTNEVNFEAGQAHFRNKGWILFISCWVLTTPSSYLRNKLYPLIPLFTNKRLTRENSRDLSETHLLVVTGFSDLLTIGGRNPEKPSEHKVLITYFIKRLIYYLIDKGLNIDSAWFKASKDYLKYLKKYRWKNPIKDPMPTVLYPEIYVNVNNDYKLVYTPLCNIFQINAKNSPRDVYLVMMTRKDLVVEWKYVKRTASSIIGVITPIGAGIRIGGFRIPTYFVII